MLDKSQVDKIGQDNAERFQDNGEPTLDTLLNRLKQATPNERAVMDRYYRAIATMQVEPIMRDTNAIFAAQCMCILLEHTKDKNPFRP